MKKVEVDRLEARILGILKDWYPITVEELRDELGVNKVTLERALKALMTRGIVQLEPLSDKTYIRLLVPEIVFETPEKDRKKRPPKDGKWDDAIMYA